MHILLTDETNLSPAVDAEFFVYGGLLFRAEVLPEIDAGIARIRNHAGYRPQDELKFETRSRPQQVSIDAARKAKQDVVELCIKNGCRFIACVVLHKIAQNEAQETLVRRGANHVIGRFNSFLTSVDDFGICVVDRLPSTSEYRYLTNKFTQGLDLDGGAFVALDRIKLFAASCINASHVASAMDIVLGAFRYSINAPKNRDSAKTMMSNVMQMIWHSRKGDNIHALEKGLIFRPKRITVKKYEARYSLLLDHINELIKDATF